MIGVATSAHAATITQSLDFRLNAGLSNSVLNFTPFDSAQGILQSVEISYEATRRHAWGLWNISRVPAAVPYDVFLKDTTFTLDANVFEFVDLHYGPAVTPTLATVSAMTYASEFNAGRAEFLLGLDPSFVSAFQPVTSVSTINGTFVPASFGGTLNIAYAFDPGVFTIDSNSFLSGSLVDVFGAVKVTYTYQAVPESAVGLGFATLLVGMCAVAYRKRQGGMGVS